MALEIYMYVRMNSPKHVYVYSVYLYSLQIKRKPPEKKNCEEIFSTSDVCHGRHMDWFHHIWVRSEYTPMVEPACSCLYCAHHIPCNVHFSNSFCNSEKLCTLWYNRMLWMRHPTHTHNTQIPYQCTNPSWQNDAIWHKPKMESSNLLAFHVQAQNFFAFNNCETLMVTMT